MMQVSSREVQRTDTQVNLMAPVVSPRATLVHDQSVLGKSLVVRGEITGSGSLHLLGELQGSIELPGCYVHVGGCRLVERGRPRSGRLR